MEFVATALLAAARVVFALVSLLLLLAVGMEIDRQYLKEERKRIEEMRRGRGRRK